MQLERKPAFAGRFYPATREDCIRFIDSALEGCAPLAAIGAVAPHAGWLYSGGVAAKSVASFRGRPIETAVVFGAVHVLDRNRGSVFPAGRWITPVGESAVDAELAAAVLDSGEVTPDAGIHAQEHSIEVLLPFLQRVLPEAMILPIMVRPGAWAGALGQRVAQACQSLGRRACLLASTDLTHYGPMFGFEPAGHGARGIRWAKEINDRRFISRIAAFDAAGALAEAAGHLNACGAGAVAATIEAARSFGATRYVELAHTTSAEVAGQLTASDAVGYHAGAFLLPEAI